ncbi:MAG: hypothetical protein RSE91_00620 [Bacilli bacterium]
MEILIIAIILAGIFLYNKTIDTSKFLKDNESYFLLLKEKDYDFYVKSKYGDEVDINKLFMKRLETGFIIFVAVVLIFLSKFSFLNLLIAVILAFVVFKLQYIKLKKFYKANLTKIDAALPYYLKGLEILCQNYTVPVAMSRSIESAPIIFRDGLRKLISKIDAGDSTIQPYMDFALEYPVRDSMRMMRLLYRLGLGEQENKSDQLLTFSKNVSSLQNKAREQKYKDRLGKMEQKTMLMLVVTGGGTMLILLLSMMTLFSL